MRGAPEDIGAAEGGELFEAASIKKIALGIKPCIPQLLIVPRNVSVNQTHEKWDSPQETVTTQKIASWKLSKLTHQQVA